MTTATACEQCGGPDASPSAFGRLCTPCYAVHLPPPNEHFFNPAANAPPEAPAVPQPNGQKPRVQYIYPAHREAEPERAPYVAERLDAVLEAQDEPLEVVIGDGGEGAIATTNSKVAVAGPTGIGKTNLLIRLARSLCEGTPFLGLPIPQPRRVLYGALEGGKRGFRRRLCKVWEGASPEARSRFHLAHLTLNVVDEADLERLDALLYEVGPDIFILDPLRNAHQLEENTSHDMARLTAILDAVIDRHHCTLFLAHHDRKKPAFVRRDAGMDRIRGSTALGGWLTACLSLDADPSGPDMLVAEWVKTRDSEVLLPALSLAFDRETLDFTAAERGTPGGKVPDEAIINAIFHAGGRIKGVDLIQGLHEGCGASERWVRERLRKLVSTGEVLPYIADPKTNAKGYALPQEADVED